MSWLGERRRILVAVGVVVALVLVASLVPYTRTRVTAAGTLAEGVGLAVWRPLAPSVSVGEAAVGGGPADVYEPGGQAPVVVLVPGAVPEGRADARVRRVARSLAAARREVVVPELAVYDERLVVEDVRRLVAVVRERVSAGRKVVLVGISFGGSLALLAAADPRLDGRVAGIATFGAYTDLVGVLQAATTGVSRVGDRPIPWQADPRAEEVVRDRLAGLLPPSDEREVLETLEDADDNAGLPTAAARAVHALLTNEDPARTYPLARTLPPRIRERLDEVSPVSVAGTLADVPIVAMHARDDAVVPYGELLRLGRTFPHAELLSVDSFAHADLQLTSPGAWAAALDDLWTTWTFTSRGLRWQEPTWPWQPG